jgi:predicted metalloprotease with PDZ domain
MIREGVTVQTRVQYEVRLFPGEHEVAVVMTIRHAPDGPLILEVPTWVPGAYGFMKYGRDLIDVRAVDGESRESLPLVREGWSGFRIAARSGGSGPRSVEVSYRVYCFDPAWGELTGFVSHDQAVLLGTRYLKLQGCDGPCRVTYRFPDGWAHHHPAGARQLEANCFEYPSYRVLLDTPVVAGAFEVRSRRLHGADFHHVFLDRTVGFEREVEGFLDGLTGIAEQCHAVFGSFPFESFTYVFTFNPQAHWGLEHLTSTMIALGENLFIDRDERGRGLRVCAHELFHAWNVGRLRPAPLECIDHVRGAFSEGLWFAEGVTRYYEFLLLVRARELSPEQFLSNVVNYYRSLVALPSYERVSAADSSRATFLNHNRYPGSVNSTIDYYEKGMLIAFDMDATLRTARPATSLDRELAAFYQAHAGRGEGFVADDVRTFFGGRVTALGDLLAQEVEGPGGLTTPKQLERLGFELTTESVRYIGVVLKDGCGPAVEDVLDTGPASQSGIAPGDEIVEVQGFPFSVKALIWLVAREEQLSITVKRGHRRLRFDVRTGSREQITALAWKGTEAQIEVWRAWLGRLDFGPKAGDSIPLSSHENFHRVQTVL